MLRALRAFAWLRWRTLANSLERTAGRDRLERFSLALEQVRPLLALAVVLPSALTLAVVGGHAGLTLAAGESGLTFGILRYALLAASVMSIVGPLLMPSRSRTQTVRFLLLPLRAGTLYVAQSLGALVDPWIILILPAVLALAGGLLWGGSLAAAAVALVGGLALAVVLLGLASLADTLLQLVLRDRKRAERATFAAILLLMVGAFAPMLIHLSRSEVPDARGERGPRLPAWTETTRGYLPSELFVAAVRRAAGADSGPVAPPLATLGGIAVLVQVAGGLLFLRLLELPSTTTSAAEGGEWRSGWRIPGVSRAASAIAFAHLKLVWRTARGRSSLLSPLVLYSVFAFMLHRAGRTELGFIQVESGPGLAAVGAAFALFAALPFAVNQFAIDGAGTTLIMLAPVDERSWLAGKAIGNTLIAGIPALLCVGAAFVIFPGRPVLWVALLVGLAATLLIVLPVSALLSATFPKDVDLSSLGRSSNPHGAASLVGFFAVVTAGAPTLVIVALAAVSGRPWMLPVLLIAWLACAVGLSRVLFSAAGRLLRQRRENIGSVV